MSEPYSIIDSSGRYLASVIPKSGRNEVQFYPLQGTANSLIDEAKVSRHELQVESDIVAACWLNEQTAPHPSPKKNSKKRAISDRSSAENGSARSPAAKSPKKADPSAANGSTSHTHETTSTSLLAVALSSGELWTFSPVNDMPVAQVSVPEIAISITAAHAENHVWVYGDGGSVFEVNVVDGEVTKTIRMGRILREPCTLISQCKHKPKSGKRSGTDSQLFFAASSRLHLVDGAKSRRYICAEFVTGDAKSTRANNPITLLQTVSADGSAVAVAHENSSVVSVCDVTDSTQELVRFQCHSSNITSLRSLDDEHLVACTSKGADVFVLGEDAAVGPVATIKAQNRGVVFENFYYTAGNGVVGVWYDGTQPRFTQIAADTNLKGDYEVPVQYKPAATEPEATEKAEIAFTAGEEHVIANVPRSTLSTELLRLLSAEDVSGDAVASLCASNDDEDNIKAAVRQLSESHQYQALVDTLFEIVSARVAADPSRKTPLSVWLRWLLLAHGGQISKNKKNADSLNHLHEKLEDGMKLMTKLMALQGRLQLLEAQAELRTSGSHGGNGPETDEEEQEERELDALSETFNNTTNIEESVVYANGENDDFEDALASQVGGKASSASVDMDGVTYEDGEADSAEEEDGEEE